MTVKLSVREEEAGQRLDKLLATREPALSRRAAAELCASGHVWVDGRPARKSELARAGSEIVFELPAAPRARPDARAPLRLVLEREDLVAVDKPPGQPTAPLTATEGGTVANALVARFPEMADIGHGPLEPGLLHRLDTQTSGLLIAARTLEAFTTLQQALTSGRLTKRYQAIVSGCTRAEEGRLTKPIAPHPKSPKRVVVCSDLTTRGARPAVTSWRVLTRGPNWTLVEVEVSRAVRHQIRVHFAAMGHPLLGDTIYNGPRNRALGASHALHASTIGWVGNKTVPAFEVTAPLPEGMSALLNG